MILETNAVSALLAGDVALGRVLSVASRHQLPFVVIAEYRFGLIAARRRSRLEALFRKLESASEVLYADRETLDWYATIRHQLKQDGKPIPENDLWIAAVAKQHSLDIVGRDPHFDCVADLRRIDW